MVERSLTCAIAARAYLGPPRVIDAKEQVFGSKLQSHHCSKQLVADRQCDEGRGVEGDVGRDTRPEPTGFRCESPKDDPEADETDELQRFEMQEAKQKTAHADREYNAESAKTTRRPNEAGGERGRERTAPRQWDSRDRHEEPEQDETRTRGRLRSILFAGPPRRLNRCGTKGKKSGQLEERNEQILSTDADKRPNEEVRKRSELEAKVLAEPVQREAFSKSGRGVARQDRGAAEADPEADQAHGI